MTLGLSNKFNILERSPLDELPSPDPEPVDHEPETGPWVASRFNAQATTEDGKLMVWNSLKGSMSVFPPEQRTTVKSLLTRQVFEAPAEGLVGYLCKRGFLVHQDRDEHGLFQLRFGQSFYRTDMLELTLLASEDCNFRCQYCYEDFDRGTMAPWVREGIKQLVDRRLQGLRFLKIAWFGGEPLYGWDAIEDLGAYFHEVATESSINLAASLTTNGYLLTRPVVDKLLSWQINAFQVTLDGPPEDHDRLRQTRTGEGTFATILSNLKALVEREDAFTMDIRINFDHQSSSRLQSFLSLLGEEFGHDPRFNLRLRPVSRWGGPNDEDLQVCGSKETQAITNQLTEEARLRGIGSCDDLRKLGRFGGHVCYAARPSHFIIGANGKVMKCTIALDTKDYNVLGRLTPEGRLDLDKDKLALWSTPAFLFTEKCKSCVILPQCQGMSCPEYRIRSANINCPYLKRNLKSSLLASHRAASPQARAVRVEKEGVSSNPEGGEAGAGLRA